MKKILTILLVILLCFSLQGQVLRSSAQYIKPSSAPAAFCVGNMISNGEFTDGTDWEVPTGWTITGGVATFGDVTMGAKLRQLDANMNAQVLANTNYRIEFDITISSGNAVFGLINESDDAGYVAEANYANGHHTVDFTTPGWVSTRGLGINASTLSTTSWSIDNICLKTR